MIMRDSAARGAACIAGQAFIAPRPPPPDL